MRKRPSTASDEPLDIFANERFATALAGATRTTPPDSADPQQSHPANETPAASSEGPALEPHTPRKSPPATTARSSRKSRAAKPTSSETPLPPEPNVPLKFRVPQTLRSEFHKFKAELAAVLGGVALDDSNLARPLVELFLVEQRDRILEEAAAFRGLLKRPPNGDAVGMAEFDHTIGEIFRRARRRRSPGTSSESAAP